MDNTKTAEEILGQSCYPHECGSMIEIVTKQDALRAINEYASPLKKRIEELEAIISSIDEYIRPGMVNGPEIMKLLNPSTNGK